MPTNTYVALDKITVGTAVNSVTFSNISQNYTDLVIVANFTGSGSGNNLMMQVGNTTIDTGSNYSGTGMYGNGTSAFSWRQSNNSAIQATYAIGLEALNVSSIHLMNYSNTTTYKTVLNRSGGLSGTYNATEATVSLWRSTAAINTIKLYGLNSATISVGSTFSLYGIKAEVGDSTPKAVGGTVTSDATYYYHTFTTVGNFVPSQTLSCDILTIAGGGGSGKAGGGAGGLVYTASQSLVNATSYTVLIGSGGAKGTFNSTNGVNGSNSNVIGGSLSLTAAVGGGGGGGANGANGSSGGSGGGGAYYYPSGGGTGGAGTSGQGNSGGSASSSGASKYGSAGGGGFAAAGGAGTTTGGGAGGAGTSTYSTWGSVTSTGQNVSGTYYYAGGGGGGADAGTSGAGGNGGGGAGVSYLETPNAGLANTGGGAGGNNNAAGTNGGSGLVIIRYAK